MASREGLLSRPQRESWSGVGGRMTSFWGESSTARTMVALSWTGTLTEEPEFFQKFLAENGRRKRRKN